MNNLSEEKYLKKYKRLKQTIKAMITFISFCSIFIIIMAVLLRVGFAVGIVVFLFFSYVATFLIIYYRVFCNAAYYMEETGKSFIFFKDSGKIEFIKSDIETIKIRYIAFYKIYSFDNKKVLLVRFDPFND